MQARDRAAFSTHRLPAPALEAAIFDALREELESRRAKNSESSEGIAAANNRLDGAPGKHDPSLAPSAPISLSEQARALIDLHLIRVAVRPDRLEIEYRAEADDPSVTGTLSIPWVKPASRVRRILLEPESADTPSRRMGADERNRVSLGIAMARSWLDGLIKGTISDVAVLAARYNRSQRSIRQTLSLAFLDPALMDAACSGSLPLGYGVSGLVSLLAGFADQWKALGLTRPA